MRKRHLINLLPFRNFTLTTHVNTLPIAFAVNHLELHLYHRSTTISDREPFLVGPHLNAPQTINSKSACKYG